MLRLKPLNKEEADQSLPPLVKAVCGGELEAAEIAGREAKGN